MKKTITFAILFFTVSFQLYPQNVNGRVSSSILTFERFESESVSNTYFRTYQLLNLNINYDNYSIRTYMNLEDDAQKKLEFDPRLRLYNLYFEARNLFDIATIKLGRQPIFNSITGGSFDGVTLGFKYDEYKLTAYYGGNVPAYQKFEITDKWSDDFLLGADFLTTILSDFTFGLSYINKHFKPYEYNAIRYDDDLNPITVLIRSKSQQYHLASAKVIYELPNTLDLHTKAEYDLNYNLISRVEFGGEYYYNKKLNFNLYYNYREPMIRYNSIFSVFDYGNTQEIEAGAGYKILDWLSVNGAFGYVNYSDENSSRLNIGVSSKYGTLSYRKTLGYAGELDALSLYTAYSFLNNLITPSIGLSLTKYKLSKDDNANDLITFLGGVNVRPWRMLSADLQGQFLKNKIYKNDFRLLFKINYWFNTNLDWM